MNAVKHSGASKIDIELVRNGQKLTLAVSDDGSGFPEKLPEAAWPWLAFDGARRVIDWRQTCHHTQPRGRHALVTCKLNRLQSAN